MGFVWVFAASVWAQPSGLTVSDAWVRATVTGQESAAAYMTLSAREKVTLVGIDCDQAPSAELHEMILAAGIMKMRTQPRLDLQAGRTLVLKPGGYHIMLSGLRQPLSQGQTVPLKLRIEGLNGKTEMVEVVAQVRGLAAGNAGAEGASAHSVSHQHMH